MRTRTPRFAAGPPPLTARQEEVLHLLARGRTNYEIATALGISLEGAKYHVREIMTRLGADSREEAVVAWRRDRQQLRTEPALKRWISGFAPASWMLGGAIATVATVAAIVLVLYQRSAPGLDAPLPRAESIATPATGSNINPAAPPSTNVLPVIPADPQPYPPGTRAGVPIVDNVLAALEQRDAPAIAALLSPFEMACSATPAIGGAACPAGSAEGTRIPVLGVSGGEGSFTLDSPARRADIAAAIVTNLDSADPLFRWDGRLVAIAESVPFADDSVPGDYLLVFASGHWVAVDSAGITFTSLLPREPVSAVPTGAAFLLPPLGGGAGEGTAGIPGTIAHDGRTYQLASDLRLPVDFTFLAARYAANEADGIEALVAYTRMARGMELGYVLIAANDPERRKLTSLAANDSGEVIYAAWCAGDACRSRAEGRTGMVTTFARSTDGGSTWQPESQREGEWRVASVSDSGEPIAIRVDVANGSSVPNSPPVGSIVEFGEGLVIASPERALPMGCTGAACTGSAATPAIFDPETGFAYLVEVVSTEPGAHIEPVAVIQR